MLDRRTTRVPDLEFMLQEGDMPRISTPQFRELLSQPSDSLTQLTQLTRADPVIRIGVMPLKKSPVATILALDPDRPDTGVHQANDADGEESTCDAETDVE